MASSSSSSSWSQSIRDMNTSRPLILTIYATVIVGIVFSSFYVISSIYAGASSPTAFTTSHSFSNPHDDDDHHHPNSPHLDQASNTSHQTTENGVSVPPSLPKKMETKTIWEVPPAGSKMPPIRTFQLTKELVEPRVKDNIIIVTFGNYAFMDFVLTWVKHLTDLGVSNLLVGAMDIELLKALYWKGVPVFDMGSHMDITDVGWGSPKFHKMGREKVILIDKMLPFGYELLMCDTDMVWLKNPLPYLARFPGADVLTSTDQVIPTVVDDSLEIWQQVSGAYNIGIFHWRPTDAAKTLARKWKEMLLADETIWDQNGFNELVQKQLGPSVDEESGLVFAFDGNLKLGLLPASIFCSGHTYFVQAMYQQLRLEPYAVHTTFQYGGTEGKRHRLREAMVFYDEPEYYDSPGGFLSFKPAIPKSLMLDGEHNIETHFSLVNYQMKQIRTALAIASILNRTLVMPPLWCRLDRLWFPHPGVLSGTLTRQPFLCPLDHVFEVNVMLREQPEEEFGPRIDLREYSFFDNPLLPKQVKESWLDVQICQEGSQDCHLSNETSGQGLLKFPKHSTEEMIMYKCFVPLVHHRKLYRALLFIKLRTVLSSFKDIKVIHFSSMQDVFGGFTDKVREEKFRNRVKRYAGVWCCVDKHVPGHIYYDMYWDEKPNWKAAPPETKADDHPPW